MRRMTIIINVQAKITVDAEEEVSVQDIEDGIRLFLETEGADLADVAIDHIELDVTDSR